MSEEEKVTLKIKPFSGKPEEWPSWRLKFEAVLYGKDLLDNLESTRPVADATTSEAIVDSWMKKDKSIFYQLILHTSGDASRLVEQYRTTYGGQLAWKAMIDKYEGSGELGAVDLATQMANLRMGESEDPDQFFGKVDSLHVRLKALGHEYTEVMLRTMCMVKFPSSYKTLRTCIQANKSQSYD